MKACLTKKSLENLVGKLVSDSYGFSLDKPENKSEGATRVTFQRYIRLDKSDNRVFIVSDINILKISSLTLWR